MCGECGLVWVLHARGPCVTTVLPSWDNRLRIVSISPILTTS